MQIPLEDLSVTINLDRLNDIYYVATNETVTVTASTAQGSDIECSFNFDDGSVFQVPRLTMDHSYTQAGSYRISVVCGNRISNLRATVDKVVTAQELEEITGLSITGDRTEFGKKTTISATKSTGTVFNCEWNLGDGTTLRVDPSDFDEAIIHDFRHVNDYNVQLTCTNKLGSVTETAVVHVDIPINGLGVSCPERFTKLNEQLIFYIEAESGSRLNINVDFGDGNEDLFPHDFSNKQGINVTHKYDKEGEYFVKVQASNNINHFDVTCQYGLVIERPVQGIKITTNSPLKFSPGLVKIFFYKNESYAYPTNAIIRYDFDNGTIYEDALAEDYAKDGAIIKLYKYEEPGDYFVQITVENNVSAVVYDLPIYVQRMRKVYIGSYQIAGE